jgi:hypothetical protein
MYAFSRAATCSPLLAGKITSTEDEEKEQKPHYTPAIFKIDLFLWN